MIRVVLAMIGMFFLPFFLYAAYQYVKNSGELKKDFLKDAPINWLIIAGTILAMGTLGSLVSSDILEYERQQRATTEKPAGQTPGRSP
ncbi:MAG: DUF6111 family protein [Hyphomicrobiaceae bacterium]|nr:DUF6111 family protein [Hyphomicrobiaceae bacterium]